MTIWISIKRQENIKLKSSHDWMANISSVVEFLAWGIKLVWFYRKNECTKSILCILKTDIAWGLQKLGIISENEVPLNLKLTNNFIIKN